MLTAQVTTNSTGISRTVAEVQRDLELAEQAVHRLQLRVREAEQRAELAERAAREAWAFARTICHRPLRHVGYSHLT